jgi:hypothetical protein
MSLVGGALVVLAAGLAYGVRTPERPGGVIAVFVLVALVFRGRFALGAVLPTARGAGAGILLFLSCCSSPAQARPGGDEPGHAADCRLPLTHAIRLLQDPWLGSRGRARRSQRSVGFLVVSAVLALRLFRWE